MKSIVPYLSFYGNAGEALKFYQSVFGGKTSIQYYKDIPEEIKKSMQISSDLDDKIMHARLEEGSYSLMLSDSFMPASNQGEGKVSIAIELENEAELKRIWQGLKEKGTVTMDLADTYWGAKFGMLVDKYGFKWLLNLEIKK